MCLKHTVQLWLVMEFTLVARSALSVGMLKFCCSLFTALHVMQTRYCDEISVRPSVCLSGRLSVTRVDCDKTEERSVQIYIPYERTFILVL